MPYILQKHLLQKPSFHFPLFGIALSWSTFFSVQHPTFPTIVLLFVEGSSFYSNHKEMIVVGDRAEFLAQRR